MTTHADTPVVRAVLFYSPNCGHCHQVITEDLPPLFEKYGDRISIYLTFLEPFVIGATCAWCLSSAVIMTLPLILVTARVCRVEDAPVGSRPAE